MKQNTLQLGRMTWRELSEWFGLKPDSLSKHPKTKENKLKILKSFADYHIEGRSLYIDKIHIAVFSKAYNIIEAEFDRTWSKSRIDTCARVGEEIYNKNPEVQAQITCSTSKTYTNKVKVQKYGHNYLNDRGSQGTSEYIWLDENGVPLKKEALSIMAECASEAYQDSNLLIAAVDSDYKKHLITLEERNKAVGEIDTQNSYSKFVILVIEKLGYFPNKKTLLIDSAF